MTRNSTYHTVRILGGLLPSDLLERVGAQDPALESSSPIDYDLAPGERLGEAITRSWNRLQPLWERFSERTDQAGALTGPTRQEWLLPLSQELGFRHLSTAPGFEIEGKAYPISHSWESTPIHLVGVGVDLDRRMPGVAGAASASPHGLMQEFLNRSDDHLWGIVSNGYQLRLLRDNASLTRTAYVEFDLRETFEGDAYSDFALLWLTCHASRLEGPAGKEVLERWRESAATRGIRALDALRNGVETAIETLGSAAVAHLDNITLRQQLDDGALDVQDLYRQILRVVYRLLFLFVAEGRDLLLDPDADQAARVRYQRYYSITRLQNLAGSTRGGLHGDLWHQHTIVARALEATGEPALGLLPLGGFLWSSEATQALNDLTLPNEALLSAIRSLTTVTPPKELPQRVDYANLGAEELGSIYEALLEYIPEVNPVASTFELKATAGNEKKTTGSYYTPTSLITEILSSALDPVLDEAARSSNPEQTILDLKVVDPAAGSGHFLIAAANRIADRLARVRAGDDEPSPRQLRTALRDVISRCIYAVDINPMAIELAKVALWIEAMEPGKPLTFLDHHVVCGNGIIGATPAMVIDGIPDEAFLAKPNEGDNTSACTKHRNRNKEARSGQASLFAADAKWRPEDRSATAARISALPTSTLEDVAAKSRAWDEFVASPDFAKERLIADAYCAALTFPRTQDSASWLSAPYDAFYELRDHPGSEISDEAAERINQESNRHRFLHWHLTFPEVFGNAHAGNEDDRCGWTGGFDVILGNPPWDTLSPDRKEFFSPWIPDIASMSSKAQKATIDTTLTESPQIRARWERHRRDLFATSRFFRRSGRYRMFAPGNLGKGDLNVYRGFVELALTSVTKRGIATQVTPSGLYAGTNSAAIRAELLDGFRLLNIWGFDNSAGAWFANITAEEFAIYTAQLTTPAGHFDAAFRIHTSDDLAAAVLAPYRYPISSIREIDREALLIPEVRPGLDAQVMAKIVSNRQTFGEQNRRQNWHPYRREIDMGNDANLFTKDPAGLPVYEGRMVDIYDHRAKRYLSGIGRQSKWTQTIKFGSADKRISPQWRIPTADIPEKLQDSWKRYRAAFQDVANPRRGRSLVATAIPPDTVCGDKVPTISFKEGEEWRYAVWLALANSVVLDYVARRRIVMKMSFTVVNSLPFPDVDPHSPLGVALVERVLRLTCVSREMDNLRVEVLHSAELPDSLVLTPAIRVSERAQLRAEIDALVARGCFALSRDEFEHILDDFTKLREREEKPPPKGLGEYRTKRLALEAFDVLSRNDLRGG